MSDLPEITVNYCPVCGSDDIHETELSHGEEWYCESCNLVNAYQIELWYYPHHSEKDNE